MIPLLFGLAILVIMFELWRGVAYVHAYNQLNDRLLLLPVVQALLMIVAFGYIVVMLLNQRGLNNTVMLTLLIGTLVLSMAWRRSGAVRFANYYPRGTVDVLSFRRPAIDLKRRVRSK